MPVPRASGPAGPQTCNSVAAGAEAARLANYTGDSRHKGGGGGPLSPPPPPPAEWLGWPFETHTDDLWTDMGCY